MSIMLIHPMEPCLEVATHLGALSARLCKLPQPRGVQMHGTCCWLDRISIIFSNRLMRQLIRITTDLVSALSFATLAMLQEETAPRLAGASSCSRPLRLQVHVKLMPPKMTVENAKHCSHLLTCQNMECCMLVSYSM